MGDKSSKRAWGTSGGLSIKPGGFFAKRLAAHDSTPGKDHAKAPARVNKDTKDTRS
jgi:hypothetical protein